MAEDAAESEPEREDKIYCKKKARLLEAGQYYDFHTSLLTHVRHNNNKKVKVLLELAIQKSALGKLPCVPELLRTAVQFSHHGYETIKLIADMLPDQMVKVPPETQETILHIAVARQDLEGAEFILEKWKGMENGDVLLHKFIHIPIEFATKQRDKLVDSCQQVELPLSMAAWNRDRDMIDLLLSYGASMREVNSYGQNVFHSLVEMAANTESKSSLKEIKDTAQHLIDIAATTKDATIYGAQNLSVILSQKDKQGYTPLTLSAKLGSREMFEIIANSDVYRILDASNCVSDEYLYDVTEIDSAISNDCKSAMELIMKGSYRHVRKYYEFAELCPVLDLIRDKWNHYRKWYFIWGCVHVVFMVLYTLGAVMNIDTFYIPSIVFDCLLAVYSFLFLIQEICLLIRWRDVELGNELRNGPYRILMALLGLSTLLTLIFRFSLEESVMIPRSLSLIFGWLFTIFFTRGFKPFSSFTVMMQMAIGDVFRFAVVYLLVLVPFSASMTILFNTSTEDNKFNTFWKSSFTMFSLTLGLEEVNPLEATHYPQLATFLYITFLVTSYILLLNMMIALLSDTCSRVSSIRKDQWHLQKLGIVLYIEARILRRHRHVCGKPESVKLFQQKSTSKSTPETPREIDPHLLPVRLLGDRINHDTVSRYYFKVKTLTQRSVKEYSRASNFQSAYNKMKEKELNRTSKPPAMQDLAGKLGNREMLMRQNIAGASSAVNETMPLDL